MRQAVERGTVHGMSWAGDADPAAPPRSDPARMAVVTGGSGLVGTHVCRELARRGWAVRAVVRNAAKAATRLSGVATEIVVGDVRDASSLPALLRGGEVVIHLAAVAIERPGEGYEEINAIGTVTLLAVATSVGVERFVHMSQQGADSASPHQFLRSKGRAEDAVRASGLAWTIFRPSVIFGPEDEFVNVLARLVRLSPVIYPLPGGGGARFQPVFVGDVARAVSLSLDRGDTSRQAYPLGGPEALTLRQMVERVLAAMHERRVLVGVPVGVLRPLVSLAQHLLPSPPVTTTLLDLLAVDNTVPESALARTFGIVPTPFAPEVLSYLREISGGAALASLFRH
ncbi:MAG TPA: complex I NDUFA9 subunit family protein [Gemmatimonadaceae bacterium]|nr:complex I NDUFA9 subunit family protein [Gemmatimonadaceae bacterium]